MIDQQHVFRLPLDSARDSLAVLAAEEQGTQDQQVQSSLEQGDAFFFFSGRHATQECSSFG
jgi:hypothetical protein